MLTEAEKKWLEERRAGLCVRCAAYDDCPMIKSADFRVETCYRFRHEDYTIEKGNFEDAAEFEARVAAKLVSNNFPCRYCPDFYVATKCPMTTRGTYTDYGPFPCLLRQARLTVEAEMEQLR